MKRSSSSYQVVEIECLATAAALMCNGCVLEEARPLKPGRFMFKVAGSAVEFLVAEYALGRLEGNLKTFMRHFDDLRTITRQGRLVSLTEPSR